MVTVVTMIWGVGAVLKRPSPSSQPSQGARQEVKGGIPAGGDCRKAIQPEPLDFWPTEDTGRVGGKAVPFPPAQRRVSKFRRGAGCPFQRAALLGRQPQLPGQRPSRLPARSVLLPTEVGRGRRRRPAPSESATASFDGRRLSKVLLRYSWQE